MTKEASYIIIGLERMRAFISDDSLDKYDTVIKYCTMAKIPIMNKNPDFFIYEELKRFNSPIWRKIENKTIQNFKTKNKENKKTKLEIQIITFKREIERLRKLPYSTFLESRYWKFIRNIIFKRDMYRCVKCFKKGNLQVHHKTYINHFDEHNHLGDMETLCSLCHRDHHTFENNKWNYKKPK